MQRMGTLPQPDRQNNRMPSWLVTYLAFLVTIAAGSCFLALL